MPLPIVGATAILPAIDAAIALVEVLAPHVQELFKKGEITKEEQDKVFNRIEKIRATGGKFTRPSERS